MLDAHCDGCFVGIGHKITRDWIQLVAGRLQLVWLVRASQQPEETEVTLARVNAMIKKRYWGAVRRAVRARSIVTTG